MGVFFFSEGVGGDVDFSLVFTSERINLRRETLVEKKGGKGKKTGGVEKSV